MSSNEKQFRHEVITILARQQLAIGWLAAQAGVDQADLWQYVQSADSETVTAAAQQLFEWTDPHEWIGQ